MCKTLSDTLSELRRKSGLTANQVGEKIGKSGKTVNGWEHGTSKPDVLSFLKLCEIYKVNNIFETFISTKKSIVANIRTQNITAKFEQLNFEGQQKVLNYADDLIKSGNYSVSAVESTEKEKLA